MAAGETEKDVSPWTTDSTREWIKDVDWWRDRLDAERMLRLDEREQHRREIVSMQEACGRELAAMQAKMDEQRFAASQKAIEVELHASAEKFAGFPQQYALRGETTSRLAELGRSIADLVAASQTRVGQETGVATQRVEVAAQREQRRLSLGAWAAIAATIFTILNVLLPLLIK